MSGKSFLRAMSLKSILTVNSSPNTTNPSLSVLGGDLICFKVAFRYVSFEAITQMLNWTFFFIFKCQQ